MKRKIEEQQRSMIGSKDSKSIIFKYARYSEVKLIHQIKF